MTSNGKLQFSINSTHLILSCTKCAYLDTDLVINCMDSAILWRRVPLLFLNWICSSSVIESLLSLVRPLSAETVWMEWRRLGNMMIDSEDVPLRLKRYTLSFIILYDFWLKEKYLYSSVGYRQEPQRYYRASEEVQFPIEYYFCLHWKYFRYIHTRYKEDFQYVLLKFKFIFHGVYFSINIFIYKWCTKLCDTWSTLVT